MSDEKKMTYVIQLQITSGDWVDVSTAEVAPRTKRSTVIKEALKGGSIKANPGDRPRLRVLDADSAEVFEPEPYQPPVEWRLK